MHPETNYKYCKFRKNLARDTPLRGINIPKFDKILVKFSVFVVQCRYFYTNVGEIWHSITALYYINSLLGLLVKEF